MGKLNVRKSNRSGTRQCPTCDKCVPLVEHHLHGRDVPRWREPWNTAWLCPTCHDLVHLEEILIEGWFAIDGKRELVWRHKGEPEILGPAIIPPKYSEK